MTRGRLRIYLGAAPGVGKTVAMLAEGKRRADRGADVVVALVETHGREFTQAQTEGMEVIPRRHVTYQGATLSEMDLDAVLARHPRVALVDELAHTNAPGSRHEKRWQDINELLDAGIDVISTVNIQHVESLNDVVTSITGIVQRETVPDRVVRTAQQIDLVDMSPEALRRRMAHGNIYSLDKVEAALGNYFRVGNLAALRELALLWLADRVDEGLLGYRADHGIDHSWPARERVVVALSGGPEGEVLLRRGARIASRGAGGEMLAVYVARSDGLSGASMPDVARLHRLTEELGGSFHSVTGADAAAAILDFSKASNASQIVIGTSRRPRWQRYLSRGISDRIIDASDEVDVHVVALAQDTSGFRAMRRRLLSPRRQVGGYGLALTLPAIVTVLLLGLQEHTLALTIPLYMLVSVVVALVGGMWPAVLAAIVGSLAGDWFFAPPFGTFTIQHPTNAAALVVTVIVAVLVASLVNVSARRAAAAINAQNEATAMAGLTNVLLGSTDQLALLLDRSVEMFHRTGAAVVEKDVAGHPSHIIHATDGFDPSALEAGAHEPIDSHHDLVLQPADLPASQQRLVSAFAVYAGAILQRRELMASAAAAAELARDNSARTALLSAVSHDLRTPLAGIKAAIESLRSTTVTFEPADEAELMESIECSADRLDDLIGNLLDMSRLQAGALVATPATCDLGELLPEYRAMLSAPQRCTLDVSPTARNVVVDAGLLERVVVNVAENALRHQSTGHIEITSRRIDDVVQICVVDHGPGIPAADRDLIFEPFQRRGDAPGGDGVGLGLAVARGLTEAMSGVLHASDTCGGGLTMVISLPTRPGQRVTLEDAQEDDA